MINLNVNLARKQLFFIEFDYYNYSVIISKGLS